MPPRNNKGEGGWHPLFLLLRVGYHHSPNEPCQAGCSSFWEWLPPPFFSTPTPTHTGPSALLPGFLYNPSNLLMFTPRNTASSGRNLSPPAVLAHELARALPLIPRLHQPQFVLDTWHRHDCLQRHCKLCTWHQRPRCLPSRNCRARLWA